MAERRNIAFEAEQELVTEIERVTNEMGVSRSDAIRALIKRGVREWDEERQYIEERRASQRTAADSAA